MSRFIRIDLIKPFALATILGLAPAGAGATVITSTWNAGTTGDWSTAANWSSSQVPDNNSTDQFNVIIDAGAGNSVATLDRAFNPFLTRRDINSLTVTSGDTLNLLFNTELDLVGPGGGGAASIVNNGTINMLDTSGTLTAKLGLSGVDLTLSGGGMLDMNNSAGAAIGDVSSTPGLTFTNQSTIVGSGSIGQGSVGIDNQGLIDANDAGQTLSLATDASGLTNGGTLRASGGGILDVFGSAINNVGGSINAGAASTIKLRGGSDVSGGTVDVAGTGELDLGGSSIGSGAAVTNGGLIQSDLTTTNTIDANIDNTGGSIVVQGNLTFSPGVGSTLNITNSTVTGGAVTVEAGVAPLFAGTLNLDTVQFNANSLGVGSQAKTTLTDTTISGATTTTVDSFGRVVSTGGTNTIAGALTLPGGAGNDSGLKVLNGSTLTLNGGAKTIDGFVEVKDGSVLNVDVNVAGAGSWFAGDGTINLNGVTVAARGSSFGLGSTLGPTGGILNLDGATLDLGNTSSGLNIGVPPSEVHGNGTIIGPTAGGPFARSVLNSGLMSPGFASAGMEAGLIEIQNRDYIQTNNGVLAIDLGGLTLADFDRLLLTGGANAVFGTSVPDGGLIDVSLFGGFDPLAGSTFDIVTANDIIGFNLITFNLPTLTGGRFFDASLETLVSGKAIRLSVLRATTGVPEPGALALFGAGLVLLGWTRRRRRCAEAL